MKSYQVFENAQPIKEVELDTPIPEGDEVLIKTIACGVCHTDIHIHDGFFDIGNGKKNDLKDGTASCYGSRSFW
jgi:D-arabinose 1-dehydrogenase-like Zn-dependent alcohol dehydrogenase